MRIPPLPAAALLLAMLAAGCGEKPAAAPTATATAADGGYIAKVKALPAGQRVGVLLRAIRDAGQPCQQVVAEKAVPSATGGAWLATCEDQGHWVVAIANDGSATVVNARDLQNQPRS